ncbi:Transposon Ty3-I Gag-Pol polyprotein [Pelomyxa schiedti]|nr:Transposon Ty3-I Gag-Pol polyprotein [Pelomyxa schiedti]
MDKCLKGLIGKICLVYIDDIIIMGHSFEEHIQNIWEVLTRLRGANLKAKASKCKFFHHSVSYLGHTVSEKGIQMDEGRIKVLTDWKAPTQWKGDLETFVNIANYYSKFIPDLASLAAPLRTLGRRDAVWVWKPLHEGAFRTIKELIAKQLLLEYPDYNSGFKLVIHTDASALGMGAALVQNDARGVEHIIELASRVTSKTEKLYPVWELEATAIIWALKKFQGYIHGVGCTVQTDHKALTQIQNLDKPMGKMARWQMLLEDYGAVVEYRAGKDSGDVDSLSRLPCIPQVARGNAAGAAGEVLAAWSGTLGTGLEGWQAMQERDGDCCAIQAWNEFVVRDGVLFHINAVKKKIKLRQALVVPLERQEAVIRDNHDSIFAGHMSAEYTLVRIQDLYWWTGMRRDVEKYCKSCEECTLAKGVAHTESSVGHPLPVPTRPGVCVSIDYVGPLPVVTKKGKRYILVMIDQFSGDVELQATKSADAKTAARMLARRWICTRGVPTTLISDRGSHFVNEVMEDICRCWNINHKKSTPYHPQTDGKTERFNRMMKDMLRIFVDKESKDDWDEILPFLAFAYRTSVSRSTGFSPFFLERGRDARMPSHEGVDEEERAMLGGYTDCQVKRIREAWRLARNTAET